MPARRSAIEHESAATTHIGGRRFTARRSYVGIWPMRGIGGGM
jgi:hypothetical protein